MLQITKGAWEVKDNSRKIHLALEPMYEFGLRILPKINVHIPIITLSYLTLDLTLKK